MWEKTVTINIALEDNPIHKWHYVTFRHILKQKKKGFIIYLSSHNAIPLTHLCYTPTSSTLSVVTTKKVHIKHHMVTFL